jgi:hypothetical protein
MSQTPYLNLFEILFSDLATFLEDSVPTLVNVSSQQKEQQLP